MSRLDTPRLYSLVVTKGTSAVEVIKAFRAPDAKLAYEAARDAGYTPIAIYCVN